MRRDRWDVEINFSFYRPAQVDVDTGTGKLAGSLGILTDELDATWFEVVATKQDTVKVCFI